MIYFASVGMTIIVTQSGLFERFREYVDRKSSFFGELFSCPLCFGFWAGVFMSMYSHLLYGIKIDPFMMGCASSIISFLTFKFMNLISALSEVPSYLYVDEDETEDE